MAIRTGQLRDRVTLQRATEAADATGQPMKTWTPLADGAVWAQIVELSGREAILAGQMKSTLTHRVTIRRYTGLTSADRVIWGTRTLHIEYVSEPERPHGMYMEIGCKEAA